MVSRSDIAEIAARLRASRRALVKRTPSERVSVISAVVENWLAADSVWMRRAVDELAEVGRFSRPMLEAGLPTMIAPLRGTAIEELVDREMGDWPVGGGPELALHVLPSNLPGHAAIPAALSLALGVACVLKSGRDDRVFARLWVESFREVDAEIGGCVESVYWQGGEGAVEDLVLKQADLVTASGSDEAMADLGRRCRGRFVGHGHRVSCAVVGCDADQRSAAALLAADVAIWDQLGCLSPHVCFVEGGLDEATSFARELTDEFAALAATLPATGLTAGAAVAVRRFREAAAWRHFGGGVESVFEVSKALESGSVVVEQATAFLPTPQHRCVRVVPVPRAEDVVRFLQPLGGLIEGVGLAGSQTLPMLAQQLRDVGVARVVELGQLQLPSLEWRPSGRPRVGDWFTAR